MMFAAMSPLTRESSISSRLIVPPTLMNNRNRMQMEQRQTEATQAVATTATQDLEEAVFHPPRSSASNNHRKSQDPSYLVSFSATVSEDVDDFVLLAQTPTNATTTTTTTAPCLYSSYCGALNCWDADSASPSAAENSTVVISRYEQIQAQTESGEEEQDEDDDINIYPNAVANRRVRAPPRVAPRANAPSPPPSSSCDLVSSPKSILTACWQDDPILQARHSAGDLLLSCGGATTNSSSRRGVHFDSKTPDVYEYEQVPAHTLPELFWSDGEGYALRNERKTLLQQFKQHISYAPLVPWTEENDSIRGLEDHYAEMIGKTASYYIRKRHEDLVLREHYRLRYSPHAAEKLATVAEQSAEDERERALEMAQLDACMAKEEGQEGATTSPVGAPLFTSGEAFLHTLMVRLRDYA